MSHSAPRALPLAALAATVLALAMCGTAAAQDEPTPPTGTPSGAPTTQPASPPAKALRQLPRVKRQRSRRAGSRTLARTAAIGGMGYAVCVKSGSQTFMTVYPPTVTGPDRNWTQFYNGVAIYQSGLWRTDNSQWVGPFWANAAYPGWYYYNGRWVRDGSSYHTLGWGHSSRGIQWAQDTTTGQVRYEYVRTHQYRNGGVSEGACWAFPD